MGRITDLLFGRREAMPSAGAYIGLPSAAGLVPYGVTGSTVAGLSAVWGCLNILSNGVAQLEWKETRGNLELPNSRLTTSPLGFATRREWVSYVVSVLALYDYCYLLKVGGEDSEGVPMGLLPLDPTQVAPKSYTNTISPFITADTYMVGGTEVARDRLVILRRSPTPGSDELTGGVIRLARTQFAGYLAAENYAARYWQAGGAPTTVLETDAQIPDPIAVQISDKWRQRRAMGPDYAPLLQGGIKAREMGADVTNEAAVEARREMVADIGRYFGIPTAILNAPAGDSETYASTESQGIYLVTYTLSNYIGAIEDAISSQLPGGRKLVMRTERLTRSTLVSQAQAMNLATAGKAWMTQDEAREVWGLGPVENAADLESTPKPTSAAMGATNA